MGRIFLQPSLTQPWIMLRKLRSILLLKPRSLLSQAWNNHERMHYHVGFNFGEMMPRSNQFVMTESRFAALLTCLLSAVVLFSAPGCGDDSKAEKIPASHIPIVIDKSQPERLLTYYFGGYIRPEPDNPFEAGVLVNSNGRRYVDMESLEHHVGDAASYLTDTDGDNRIDWDELEAFIDATYYSARGLPVTLDSLFREAGFEYGNDEWLQAEVNGVMTTALRRIHVKQSAVRAALEGFWENEEQLVYPDETIFFGEHYIDDRRVETTVMRKRTDGYWDFAVYGPDDSLTGATDTPPKELRSPVQCVGCHFGSKLFEPEKSFPAQARPGPHGPRRLHVNEELRDSDVVLFFDEHRKRSDTVLGLYSTLFVAELRRQKRDGTISETDAALLDRLAIR